MSFELTEYEQRRRSKSPSCKRLHGIKRPVPRYEPMVTEVLFEYIADDITTRRRLTDEDMQQVVENKNIRRQLTNRSPLRHRCVRLSEPERRQRISEVQGISIENVKKIDREQRRNIGPVRKVKPHSSFAVSKIVSVCKGFFRSTVLV
jgi:hypothetical protein